MTQPKDGRILLSVTGYEPKLWEELLSAEREVVRQPDAANDPSIEYAVVWKHEHGVLSNLPNLKIIFSLGAGVDHVTADKTLPDVPLVRVVADNLTAHMTEYVVWRVLDHHRQGVFYRSKQSQTLWQETTQPVASEISVGIMGLGELGRSAASALKAVGFSVNGWSRTNRPMEGVRTFHGEDGLKPFLAATDILVVLLPHTPQTEGIIGYDLLEGLRRDNGLGGSVLINAGRGKLQKEAEILRALDDGILKEASLDVFETEPLAKDSALWSHPRVFVTPHAAASSDPRHIVPGMLDQIRAFENGEPLKNVVDRSTGY